ncbi:MAG: DNA alkylation repair protein [Anaerolineae bacterium]|nr:DNA alkylation repair protein [Anaerolineae bacterium]
MSESTLFKDNLNSDLARSFGAQIQQAYPEFDASGFAAQIAPQLPPLELKERVAVFTEALHDYLPPDYAEAIDILLAIFGGENAPEAGLFKETNGWAYWSIAYFVERYGLDDFDTSLAAMPTITKHFSCEFAIRPFLAAYPAQTLAVLDGWVSDPSPHVRRLVSEGTRPRLPWGMHLTQFIADPTPTLALLAKLKDDESEYVRRSVANHLNDITKDNPALAIAALQRWNEGEPSQEIQWITRHALRSLVKAGDPEALALLGFGAAQVSLSAFSITPDAIAMGDTLELTFTLHSQSETEQKLVVDYVIHFVKANGKTSPKVFKLKTAVLPPQQTFTIQKKHTIKPITTRRYYPGEHPVEIQVNGKIVGKSKFVLMSDK